MQSKIEETAQAPALASASAAESARSSPLASSKHLKKIFLALLLAIASVGWIQRDGGSAKWTAFGIAIYASPLAFYLLKRKTLFAIATWSTVFLILQSILSHWVYREHVHLAPNYTATMRYAQGSAPGFEGVHVLKTDAKGYRTLHPVDYAHKTKKRIFAIGGSTTEEIYVGNDKTWTGLLESHFPDYEVINTGTSGLQSKHHIETFWAIERYQPDVLIFLVGVNDWNWQIRRHFNPPSVPDIANRNALRMTMLGSILRAIYDDPKGFFNGSRGLSGKTVEIKDPLPKRSSANRPETREFKPTQVAEHFETSMREIADRCHSKKLRCLWLTQPNGYRKNISAEYRSSMWMTPPDETTYNVSIESLEYLAGLYNDTLKKIGAEKSIAVCDIASQLEPGFRYFYDDIHFNPTGSARVSELVAECLRAVL